MKDPNSFQPTTKHLVIIPRNIGKKRLTKAFRVAGKEKKANAKIVNHYKHKTF